MTVPEMLRAALKTTLKASFLALLAAGTATGVWFWQHHHSAAWQVEQLEQQKQKLEQEKAQLQTVVNRLSEENRVAEVLVTDQSEVDGLTRTTLLFVEYARDGSSLPAKTFTIHGKSAHLDAMVIKFDRGLIAANDPLRGHSIALFKKIFGEDQPPEKGFPIDAPGQEPDIYRGQGEQSTFERELWQNFWKLAEDKAYRSEKGVRVANGQGIWGPFVPDRLYTITLDSDGGLNLASEPLKGIYKEAMKQRLTSNNYCGMG